MTAGLLENTKANYRKVSRILTKARMVGFVPWAAIEDRVRDTHSHRVFSNQDDYIESEIEGFLDDYHRDLLQGQEHVIELWTEKDTMAPYLQRIVQPYRISVSVARGFSSLSFVRDLHDRCMQRHWDNEKPTLILYVGDADPSGMFMPEYMLNTLEEMFHTVGVMRGVRSGVQVNFQRITLTRSFPCTRNHIPLGRLFQSPLWRKTGTSIHPTAAPGQCCVYSQLPTKKEFLRW